MASWNKNLRAFCHNLVTFTDLSKAAEIKNSKMNGQLQGNATNE